MDYPIITLLTWGSSGALVGFFFGTTGAAGAALAVLFLGFLGLNSYDATGWSLVLVALISFLSVLRLYKFIQWNIAFLLLIPSVIVSGLLAPIASYWNGPSRAVAFFALCSWIGYTLFKKANEEHGKEKFLSNEANEAAVEQMNPFEFNESRNDQELSNNKLNQGAINEELTQEINSTADAKPLQSFIGKTLNIKNILIILGSAMVLGALTSVFGVGGGFFLTPILLWILALPFNRALSTSFFCILILSFWVLIQKPLNTSLIEETPILWFISSSIIGLMLAWTVSKRIKISWIYKMLAGALVILSAIPIWVSIFSKQ